MKYILKPLFYFTVAISLTVLQFVIISFGHLGCFLWSGKYMKGEDNNVLRKEYWEFPEDFGRIAINDRCYKTVFHWAYAKSFGEKENLIGAAHNDIEHEVPKEVNKV